MKYFVKSMSAFLRIRLRGMKERSFQSTAAHVSLWTSLEVLEKGWLFIMGSWTS